MATFTATLTYICTVEIEIPDSKIKASLADELKNITDYIELKFEGMNKSISVEVCDPEIVIDEYSSICKDNGNEYEWDGERLTKL